jgi:hypothetical protein
MAAQDMRAAQALLPHSCRTRATLPRIAARPAGRAS